MQTPVAYPLAFGHWHVRKDTLECRLPRRTLAVSAPGELLGEVLTLCDGRLAWKEVAATLARRWARAPIETFLGQLLQQGALVEAGEALARWTELGQLPSVHHRVATPSELPGLAAVAQRRLSQEPAAELELPAGSPRELADLLRRRESYRTFGDDPITVPQLAAVLWAAHGVARPALDAALGWHRTIASGGNMHSVRWFVAILRELSGDGQALGRGLHEACFHRQGGVSFQRLDANADAAWHMVGDPRVLRFASALVLPICEVSIPARKYGNRATLFAQLEVGQALQNAQLMATALGIAAMVRGDTVARAALEALAPHLDGATGTALARLCLPALVTGALPTRQQVAHQRRDRLLTIGLGVRLGTAGFAFTAGPIQVGGTTLYASGRSSDPRAALRKAEAEAWERRGWASPAGLSEGRQGDVPGAVDPGCLVAYLPAQYRRPAFPLRPFAVSRRYLWKAAVDVHTGQQIHVPAECVYALAALPARWRRGACSNSSTSGVAAWTDPDTALCRATLELVERDAFLRCWLRRESPAQFDPESLPATARLRVEALRASGYRVAISFLPAWVPVVSAFVQGSSPPFTAITAAADFEPEAALVKALDEAEGRAAHARAFPAVPLRSVEHVRGVEDINRYYQSPRHYRASDFFATSSVQAAWPHHEGSWLGAWPELKAHLAQLQLPLWAADLTPPDAAIDQGRQPLRVVRALVPGLLPIWFQHGLQPAGLPAFREAQAVGHRWRTANAFIHPFT